MRRTWDVVTEIQDLETSVRDLPGDRKPELRLWLRMLSCTNLISSDIRRRLRAFGLTLPQFDLMAQLEREADGLRLSDLSRRMMVSNGNLTGLVDRLIADGLVLRETDAGDRRAFVVRLTDKGRADFGRVAQEHEGWIRAMFAGLSAAEATELATVLKALRVSVRAAADQSRI